MTAREAFDALAEWINGSVGDWCARSQTEALVEMVIDLRAGLWDDVPDLDVQLAAWLDDRSDQIEDVSNALPTPDEDDADAYHDFMAEVEQIAALVTGPESLPLPAAVEVATGSAYHVSEALN